MFFKQIKLVTFDVTNTLLKFKEPPWQAYGKIARKHGFICKDEDLSKRFIDKYKYMSTEYPNFGKSSNLTWEDWWREIVRYTFEEQLPKSANVNLIATQLINGYKSQDSWTCDEGGVKLIELLKKRNISVGVISNFDPRLHDILQNMKLKGYFDFILTSYEVGFSKPDGRIFECAIERSCRNVKPSMCLHIGDDKVKDYEGAEDAGWHSLLITNQNQPSEIRSIQSLQEFMTCIQNDKLLFFKKEFKI